MRVEIWDNKKASEVLAKRLKKAKEARKAKEWQWDYNYIMLFESPNPSWSQMSYSYDSLSELFRESLDTSDSNISINYMFKYLRFVHAQMNANPPSVMIAPNSTDYSDRRAAEIADMFCTFAQKQFDLLDKQKDINLDVLSYGTGFNKVHWDALAGDLIDFDEASGEVTMEGEVSIEPVNIRNIWLDPNASRWDKVKWVFERHLMTKEEMLFRYPDKQKLIEDHAGKYKPTFFDDVAEVEDELIEYYEYTEKGMPHNGMAGRKVFLLDGGELLTDLEANDAPEAALPYNMLTDVDVPHSLYGRSFVDYLIRLQQILNQLDSVLLDNIQAHGIAKLVVFDGAEIEEDSWNNDAWDFVKISGAQPPFYVNPPQLMPDMHQFRAQLLEGMEALAGVNESMFGQVKREMSGFSLQTAIDAGNMIRHTLYTKYTKFVESTYEKMLLLVQKHYSDKRCIKVTGEEGAINMVEFKGADIADGYDVSAQYGRSFSLDPAKRREEIMQLMPLIKEAGGDLKQLIGLLNLNEITKIYDDFKIAERRQLEIFDEIIAKIDKGILSNAYIAPEQNEDHEGMLVAAKKFRMSAKFKYLPDTSKELIDRHINEREKMLSEQAVPAAPAMPPAPGGMSAPPMPGLPPMG